MAANSLAGLWPILRGNLKVRRAIKVALPIYFVFTLAVNLLLVIFSFRVQIETIPAPYSPVVIQDLQQRGFLGQHFLLPWYRWDTVHYIEIAEHGYMRNLVNTVWPPFYPFLVRLFSIVIHPPLLPALIISNLATFAALVLLYLLVAEIWDESLARQVLFWVVIFPAAFYLLAGYTESLFLALALASFLAVRHQSWLLAGIFGALAALTRLPGVVLFVPLAWEALSSIPIDRRRSWLQAVRSFVPLGLLPLATLAYSAYVRFDLKADWPWQTLTTHWNLHMGWPWEGVIRNLGAMANIPLHGSMLALFYDTVLALWAVFLLVKGLRKLPLSFSLFSLLLLLPSLVKVSQDGTLISFLRYVVPIFPLFITQAQLLKDRRVQAAWALFCVLSQGVLLFMFYRWNWVA